MSINIITEKLGDIIDTYISHLFGLGNFEEGRKIQDALDSNDPHVLLEAIVKSKGESSQDKVLVNAIIFSIEASKAIQNAKRSLSDEESK